jgi:hypothetical protein
MKSPVLRRSLVLLALLALGLAGSVHARGSLPATLPSLAAPIGPQANLTYWHTETVVSTGDVGRYLSLARNAAGYPRISFYDRTNDDLALAQRPCLYSTCPWSTETVDAAGGRGTSLAIDGCGYPHLSYMAGSSHFKYAHYDGSSWTTEVVLDAPSDLPYTSLALDWQDRPSFVAYSTITGELDYLYYDGAAWHTMPVEMGLMLDDGFPDLALDSADRPHLSYRGNLHLTYAYYDGTNWHFTDLGEPNAYQSAIDLDGAGRPHIAYYDSGQQTLNYAHFDGTDWYTETIDTVGQWSYYTGTVSLYVSPAGVVHVSFYDANERELKYGVRTFLGWTIQVVDSVGDVGAFNSLVVDDQNRPYIAYYDATNGDVKYAYLTRGVYLPAVFRHQEGADKPTAEAQSTQSVPKK